MRIGYVHAGSPQHGVCRYGRILAEEARRRADLEVIETELTVTGRGSEDMAGVEEAARRLSGVDLIHLQYNHQYRNPPEVYQQ